MPPISRKKAMKRFGGIFSRPAISSAAAHFAAALSGEPRQGRADQN